MTSKFHFENSRTGTFRSSFGEEFGYSMGKFFAWFIKFVIVSIFLMACGVAMVAYMLENTAKDIRKHTPGVKREIHKTVDEVTKPVEGK